MKKRILAIICFITLFFSSFTACFPQAVRAAEESTVITINPTDFNSVLGYKTCANGGVGYLNIPYQGMESGFLQHNGPFLTEAFAKNWITFGGGMTYADLSEGAGWWYLATNSILQIRWDTRTTAFTAGWSFTLKEGTPMPYKISDGTGKNAVLDRDYTFTFLEGNSEWDNIISVTASKKVTYSMKTDGLCGSGKEPTGNTIFQFENTNLENAVSTHTSMLGNEVYDDYVLINGVSFSKLASKNVKIRYLLSSYKGIQVEDWGDMRDDMTKGSQVIFKKGLPITYQDTAGDTCEATLDATYVYECIGSNSDNDHVWACVKLDCAATVGIKTNTYSVYDTYVNVNFDDASAGKVPVTSGYVKDDVLKEQVAQEYLDLTDCSVDLVALGAQILFIPTANVFQLALGSDAKAAMKTGDAFTFKKGMPVVYNNGDNTVKAAVLDADYVFTVIDKNDARVKFSCQTTGSYALSGTLSGPGNESGCVYFDASFSTESFDDRSEDIGGVLSADVYTPLLSNYMEVSGKTGEDLVTDGWYMGRWMRTEYKMVRFYCPTDKWDLKEGEFVLYKKGMPLTYTNKAGKTVVATLDKDYGFVYNGSTFTYDATLGNEVTDHSFVDTTLTGIHGDSAFADNTWKIQFVTERPGKLPGTAGETEFVNVSYKVGDQLYSGRLKRVNSVLELSVSKDILSSDADGITLIVLAGEYKSNGKEAGIKIVEDFTFYLIGGAFTTEYDFDNPDFTATIYHELGNGAYVVDDADTVTVDGTIYHRGDKITMFGVHTLVYTLHAHEYSRKLVLYYRGDANENGKVSITDYMRMLKYLKNRDSITVTEAGEKAMDMDESGEVNATDRILCAKYLIVDSGALPIYPTNQTVTAMPSKAASSLIIDYTPQKADKIRTGKDIYFRDVTTLKWIDYENADTYTIKLSTAPDMTKAVTYTSDKCTLDLINLLADTNYYWTVTVADKTSEVQSFHTYATIRTLTIDGVSNTRDGGGWKTTDGHKIKQGMYYRGGNVDGITQLGKMETDKLQIKTDLDLRKPEEAAGLHGASPLGADVQYLNYSGPYYWNDTAGINTSEYRQALLNEIRTFANPDNYPIYVHCAVGRDRTGTICFLINALCGVSEQDLYLDYEFSVLSAAGTQDNATTQALVEWNFGGMYNNLMNHYAKGGTIQNAVENFMLEIGITQDEIAQIRNILVEK